MTDSPLILKHGWKLVAVLLAAMVVAALTVRGWRDFVQSAVAGSHVETSQRIDVGSQVTGKTFRQAQANLDKARSLLRRNQVLFENGLISEAALEESRKTIDVADAQARMAQGQLARGE